MMLISFLVNLDINLEADQAEIGPTQEAEKAIATLERESLNFLAYIS